MNADARCAIGFAVIVVKLCGSASTVDAETNSHLPRLIAFSPSEMKACEAAQINLACAESLFGAETLNLRESLTLLDQWAKHVKSETERHLYRFRKSPNEFQNCEGYFRMLMMVVVLYEDFGVRYNTNRMSNSTEPRANDGFFADSRDVFIHGLLGPRRTGTCSSMPVLYVALGRRLGYPLKLVKAKGHLFARWESADGRERFNIEATSKGLNSFPDNYYEQWPYPMSETDLKSGHYVRSLTAPEELALFLQTRALLESKWQVTGSEDRLRTSLQIRSALART